MSLLKVTGLESSGFISAAYMANGIDTAATIASIAPGRRANPLRLI
jgi:hypothetical protein